MNSKIQPENWLSKLAINCFDQISTIKNKVKSRDCLSKGLYPVIDQGQIFISGYINDKSKLIKVDTPICIFGDHTRIVKWVTYDFVPGADGTKLLKPKAFIHPRYAYYSLCALNIPDKGYSRHFKYFKELEINLPGWVEQKIIAEKLDTLLAQVDSTKARLEQVPQILKRFRQAVLTAAISGRLTDEWRKLTDLHTIWTSYTLGELVTIDRGSSPRPIKNYITTSENGVNWIKIGDAREGEKYIRSTKERITKEGSKQSRRVIPGDFILSNSMSLGRAYIVEIEGCVHDGWFILRLPKNIDKNYFYYLLSSSELQTQFSNLAVGGVVQNIRSELVKKATVNIPPEKEQIEIVRRVEQLFAYADTIEKQVNNALTRVNNLTQSILAKAFRGELTAQWRAENPELISGENSAAALLEKIKAERAASGSKKAPRKKK